MQGQPPLAAPRLRRQWACNVIPGQPTAGDQGRGQWGEDGKGWARPGWLGWKAGGRVCVPCRGGGEAGGEEGGDHRRAATLTRQRSGSKGWLRKRCRSE